MPPVTIKINKSTNQPETPSAKTVNQPPPVIKKKQPGRPLFWLLILLVVILAAGLAAVLFFRPAPPYQNFIPSDAAAVFYFNQARLVSSARTLNETGFNWPPFVWFKNTWNEFLTENKLEAAQISGLFDEPMALVWLPDTNRQINWLFLATKKGGDGPVVALNQIESRLKQNYNLVADVYRQTAVTEIKPLGQDRLHLYYAQIKNYFLVSNSVDSLKETIDRIIGR